jgi:hypothetical protein
VTRDGYSAATIDIEVPEGRDLEGIELRMSPSTGITLFVLQPGGAPAGSVNIAALDAAERTILSGFYQPGEGGRLRLADLPAGDWTLLVGGSGSATARALVTAPGEAVTVVLPESGGLRITVADLVGTNLQARVTLRDTQGQLYMTTGFQNVQKRFGMVDGRATLPLLPVGIWSVEIQTMDEQQSWSSTVRVIPGRTLDVVVD